MTEYRLYERRLDNPTDWARLSLQVSVEIFMRPHRFQINQSYSVINGVTQQVKLPLAMELVDIERSEIAFLFLANIWVLNYCNHGIINICGNVIV